MTGGGVKAAAKTMTITNCDFINNIATFGGGGLNLKADNLTLTNCNIISNDSKLLGGGMTVGPSNVIMRDCKVIGNKIANIKTYLNNGGGISFNSCTVNMYNCEVTNNTAPNYGGGIVLKSTKLTLTNCNVSGNKAGGGFPDIYNLIMRILLLSRNDSCDNIFRNFLRKE